MTARESLQAIFGTLQVGIQINPIGSGGLEDHTFEYANGKKRGPYGMTGAEPIGMDVYQFYRGLGVMDVERTSTATPWPAASVAFTKPSPR